MRPPRLRGVVGSCVGNMIDQRPRDRLKSWWYTAGGAASIPKISDCQNFGHVAGRRSSYSNAGRARRALSGLQPQIAILQPWVAVSVHCHSPMTAELNAPVGCRSIVLQVERHGRVVRRSRSVLMTKQACPTRRLTVPCRGCCGGVRPAQSVRLERTAGRVNALCADMEYVPAGRAAQARTIGQKESMTARAEPRRSSLRPNEAARE